MNLEIKTKKQYTLTFDSVPKLIFVSMNGNLSKGESLYIDGKRVNGIKGLMICSHIDDATTHEVEYVTAMAGERREDKNAKD